MYDFPSFEALQALHPDPADYEQALLELLVRLNAIHRKQEEALRIMAEFQELERQMCELRVKQGICPISDTSIN